MKSRPIHENLDTSFINLPALIRYLRRRQFAGRVRIELSGYEADIFLSDDNQMRVREHDHIAGRVAEGDEAMQRVLIRSREPGGIINVFQTVAEARSQPDADHPKPEMALPKPAETAAPVVVDFYPNGNGGVAKDLERPSTKPALPNLPFEFSNQVEMKAKSKPLTDEERRILLGLIGELLGTADRALSMAKLNFPNAYHKACMEICTDYPFLMSLEYSQGKVTVPEMPPAKIFVAGTLEALRRILDRLGSSPKFAEIHRFTSQKMLALAGQRKEYYQKYSIALQLNKLLGV